MIFSGIKPSLAAVRKKSLYGLKAKLSAIER